MARWPKDDGYYHRASGGAWVASKKKYAADQEYERADGGRIVAITTIARHCAMPIKIRSARELRRLSGVGKVTTLRPNAGDETRKKAYRILKKP